MEHKVKFYTEFVTVYMKELKISVFNKESCPIEKVAYILLIKLDNRFHQLDNLMNSLGMHKTYGMPHQQV